MGQEAGTSRSKERDGKARLQGCCEEALNFHELNEHLVVSPDLLKGYALEERWQKMFVKNGNAYKGRRNGLRVKVVGIKVEFDILTENDVPMNEGRRSIDMWKFRKDFEDENPSAEYLPKKGVSNEQHKTTVEGSPREE